MENHLVEWENLLQMAMFNNYVNVPEGRFYYFVGERLMMNHGFYLWEYNEDEPVGRSNYLTMY